MGPNKRCRTPFRNSTRHSLRTHEEQENQVLSSQGTGTHFRRKAGALAVCERFHLLPDGPSRNERGATMKLIPHSNWRLPVSTNGTSFKSLASCFAENNSKGLEDQSPPRVLVEMLGEEPMTRGTNAEVPAAVWSTCRARLADFAGWLYRKTSRLHRVKVSQVPVEQSQASDWGAAGTTPAMPSREATDVVIALVNLLAHFNKMLRGWSRVHRYKHSFRCGAEACVQFRQYRRAALRAVRWRRPCRCKSLGQWLDCRDEFETWLEEAERHEGSARHFRFRHEGSLTFDLSEEDRIIFQSEHV